jgi:hypothetical protein
MKVSEFLDAVETIEAKNCGGCLFFCYVFYLWLKKNNLPTETFFIRQYADALNNDRLYKNMEYKAPGSHAYASNHFTWFYNGIEYDAEGKIHRLDEIKGRKYTYVDLKQICEYNLVESFCKDALIKGSWNPRFNRRKAFQIVEENLGIDVLATLI